MPRPGGQDVKAKRKPIDDRRANLRGRIADGIASAIHLERLVVGALLGQPDLAAEVDITGDDVTHFAPQVAIDIIRQLADRGAPWNIGNVLDEIWASGREEPDAVWLTDCVVTYAGWPTWTPVPLQRCVDQVRGLTLHLRELAERDEIAGRIAAGGDLGWAIERLTALHDRGPSSLRAVP